ncbi:MAG TPA: bifunctional serine/threonine-protein kinase/formylglycine-generating enzyme family protein [Pseudomonadota bacterium]|nr:bifunctional serine/threonine-protein kinase/formylglycine-generating enzyme family protein [Pseudomonadota bacterium]
MPPAEAKGRGTADLREDGADDSLVGQRIGQYEITREIGRGGMGVVYEAIHGVIGQRVAVKTLSTPLAREPRSLARFLREARVCSLIEHEGLPQIFDYGQLAAGTPYILMEFLKGEMLRARLQRSPRGRLGIQEAVRIARQVAAAMCAAHGAGVLHRDLKPDNVILIRDSEALGGERAKVLDFGIAHLTAAVPENAGSHSVPLGTPGYMSPEQCLGQEAPGPGTDVYSLGIMLYEMLWGEPPFSGSREELRRRQIFEQAVPLRSRLPELPSALASLVERMLAKPSGLRPTMAEVHAGLSEQTPAAANLTPPSAPPPAPRQTGQQTETTDGAAALPRPMLTPTAAGTQLGEPAPPSRVRRWFRLAAGVAAVSVGLFGAAYQLPLPRSQMVQVPAGQFTMGSTMEEIETAFGWARRVGCTGCTRELFLRESPARSVQLSAFAIDKTEVTNQEFAAWLNRQPDLRIEAGRRVLRGAALLLDLWAGYGYSGIIYQKSRFAARPGMERQPVSLLTWDAADAYCRAQGKRLPTEAEWEYAARGPAGLRFPWGDNEPGCAGVAFGRGEGGVCAGRSSGTQEVGSAAQDRSPLGVRDLGGNVAEWVLDRFTARYPACPAPCRDPQVLDNSEADGGPRTRVVRGGAWFRKADSCRGAGRSRRKQEDLAGDIGFRCARTAAR